VSLERCVTRVSILAADGTIRRQLTGWRSQSAAPQAAVWDGEVSSHGRLVAAAEGEYAFLVECRDAAGNSSNDVVKVVVDRTLESPTASPGTLSPNGDGAKDFTTLGFTLTRAATVRLAVVLDGTTMRSFALGPLGAGTHAVVWDGADRAGQPLGSSRPRFTVTATSSLGVTSVSRELIVDLYRPKLFAPAAQTVAMGKTARLTCTARDPFSVRADLSYTITDVAGATVAGARRGWVATGKAATWTWRPPVRGLYTVTCTATDLGGNRERVPAVTLLTVR
jgi:hypothetical protein